MGRQDIHTENWEGNANCQKRGSKYYEDSKIILAYDWENTLTRWNLSWDPEIASGFEMEHWKGKDTHDGSNVLWRVMEQ